MDGSGIFGPGFLEFLKTYVDVHHSIYPTVPPQGIYFEALVEKTFRAINRPLTVIRAGGTNQPRYGILFEGHRISLKTETGLGTKRDLVNITRGCGKILECRHSAARSIRGLSASRGLRGEPPPAVLGTSPADVIPETINIVL